MTRREFALWLAMTPGVGGRTVTRVLARCDLLGYSPGDFQRLGPDTLKEEFGIKQMRVCERLASQARGNDPILPRLDALGVTWITMADAHYPALVEQFEPDPPGVLFACGNLKLLEAKTFAVLSSRNTTPAGLDLMEKLAEEGVLKGEVVVSGHDTPEYQRSALVPLRWGAPRILCLDRGLFPALGENLTEEPFRAARLWRYQFDPRTDLVITPFRPEAKFIGVNNQIRDRLIAGLSRRADFIEVSPGGNMEKLARMGLKADRAIRISDRSVGFRSLRELGAEVI